MTWWAQDWHQASRRLASECATVSVVPMRGQQSHGSFGRDLEHRTLSSGSESGNLCVGQNSAVSVLTLLPPCLSIVTVIIYLSIHSLSIYLSIDYLSYLSLSIIYISLLYLSIIYYVSISII